MGRQKYSVDDPTCPNGPHPKGTLTLERWEGEWEHHHRGLLLYAMQHPETDKARGDRSQNLVSKCCGVSHVAVRNWRRTHEWDKRIGACADAERVAVTLYRIAYMEKYGKTDLPVVAHRVVEPLTKYAGAADGRAGTEADAIISKARLEASAAVRAEQAIMETVQAKRKAERDKVEQFRGLVDATLGETARLLRSRELRVAARDIPSLLSARQMLTDYLNTHDERSTTERSGVESARVKHARDTGGDLVEALWMDLQELVVILGMLRTRRDEKAVAASDYAAQRRKMESAEPSPPVSIIDTESEK